MGRRRMLAAGVIAASAAGVFALAACGTLLDVRPDDADAAAGGDGSPGGSTDGPSNSDAGSDGASCTATFSPSGKVVFVSEPWKPGGGLAAADVACNTSAAHAGYCQRTFVALLGTSTARAYERLLTDGGAWQLPVGGAVVFDTPTQLEVANVAPKTSIDQLADGGSVVASTSVWTGAHATLTAANPDQTCKDWRSGSVAELAIVGLPAKSPPTAEWIEKQGATGTETCDLALPVLCFEQ